jgi:tripartite-type tricarboxylate transporter receptor subunit TctC
MRTLQMLVVALAVSVTIGGASVANAQTWPTRPITMVVPFGAGGATDTIGRIVAEGMRASLGQPVVIENVPGASGTIGVNRVARAAADGYTLGIGGTPTYVWNGAMIALAYDVLNDFEPISLIVDSPMLIVARKSMAAKDLRGLIAWLKENPDKASQGTTGAGGALHLAGVFFQRETGTRVVFVPYRLGSVAALQDLVAGQIDLLIDMSANSLPQLRAGAIKAYAVMAHHRLAAAPDIPTVDDAGLPGFYMSVWHGLWVPKFPTLAEQGLAGYDFQSWYGLWAPKGTPKSVIGMLNAAVVAALADPMVRQRLVDLGQEIYPREQQTPEALGAFQKAEIAKWWPIIKAANIKGE